MLGRWGIVFAVWSLAACSEARTEHDPARRRRHDNEVAADAAARDAANADADADRPTAQTDASERAGHDAPASMADAAMPPAPADDAAPLQAGAPAPERGDAGLDDAGADVPATCEPARSAGKLLVVFDRSESMEAPWVDSRLKRVVAVELLSQLLTTVRVPVSVAGQFFPSRDPNACICDVANPDHWIPGPGGCCLNGTTELCDVNPIEAADQIGFVSADEFLKQLPARASEFASDSQTSGTPIVAALTRADEALAEIPMAERWAVLLVTDANPTCNGVITDALTRLASWQAAGVPTLVVSFATDTVSTDTAKQLAAISGNRAPFDPTDVAALRAELAKIVASAACR